MGVTASVFAKKADMCINETCLEWEVNHPKRQCSDGRKEWEKACTLHPSQASSVFATAAKFQIHQLLNVYSSV